MGTNALFLTGGTGGAGSGTGGGDPGMDDEDPVPVAPINGQLIVLALMGIAYVIYTFRNYKKIV